VVSEEAAGEGPARGESLTGPEHPHTLLVLNNLAYVYLQRRNFKDAEVLLAQSLGAQSRVSGEDSRATLRPLRNLANLYLH
jgi:hypothetical protein